MNNLQRISLVALAMAPTLAFSQTDISPSADDVAVKEKIYSPFVERTVRNSSFAEGVYWGDTHLHTRYSSDSGMIGNRLGPDEAYRFAKGEEVLSTTGQRARLIRPLDFLVISDHAEALGLAPFIVEANPDLLATENGKKWFDMVNAGEGYGSFGSGAPHCSAVTRSTARRCSERSGIAIGFRVQKYEIADAAPAGAALSFRDYLHPERLLLAESGHSFHIN